MDAVARVSVFLVVTMVATFLTIFVGMVAADVRRWCRARRTGPEWLRRAR